MGPLSKTKPKPKPKATKDFEKKKYKVGQKQVADNETRTDFRAKRVVMASQSILSNAPVTVESTTTDILTRCRHYSAKKRQEAFLDLKRLDHIPESLFHTVLSTVFNGLTDEDVEVRKILRGLVVPVVNRLAALTSNKALTPFADAVALHLRSGLCHVDPQVRKDVMDVLRSMLTGLPRELMVGLIRKNSAIEIIKGLCEQKLRPEWLDVIKFLVTDFVLPRDSHPSQWRITAIINSNESQNLEILTSFKEAMLKELGRLSVAYAPIDHHKKSDRAVLVAVQDVLELLGEKTDNNSILSDNTIKSHREAPQQPKPTSKKGGSFAALMDDNDD